MQTTIEDINGEKRVVIWCSEALPSDIRRGFIARKKEGESIISHRDFGVLYLVADGDVIATALPSMAS